MIITKENIWDEARKSNLEVLKSDFVDKVKDVYRMTPLHYLAWKGVKDVLNHPSIDKIKDDYGCTTLHVLAIWDHLTKEDLRKKYPWYKKEIKNLEVAVEEIINTPVSIRFILED